MVYSEVHKSSDIDTACGCVYLYITLVGFMPETISTSKFNSDEILRADIIYQVMQYMLPSTIQIYYYLDFRPSRVNPLSNIWHNIDLFATRLHIFWL